jgi:hypothetical protein
MYHQPEQKFWSRFTRDISKELCAVVQLLRTPYFKKSHLTFPHISWHCTKSLLCFCWSCRPEAEINSAVTFNTVTSNLYFLFRIVTWRLKAGISKQTQNKCTQTSMPWVGFEPKISEFERAKTVHALNRGAFVIGSDVLLFNVNKTFCHSRQR